MEPLAGEAAQDDDALVERLSRDEAGGAEPHAVAAHEPLDVAVVGRAQDPGAQHGVRPGRDAHAAAGSDLGREPRLELGDLRRVEIAERRPHVRTERHALPAGDPLQRRVPRERLHPLAQAREPGGTRLRRLADDGRHLLGEGATRAPTPLRPRRPRGRGG